MHWREHGRWTGTSTCFGKRAKGLTSSFPGLKEWVWMFQGLVLSIVGTVEQLFPPSSVNVAGTPPWHCSYSIGCSCPTPSPAELANGHYHLSLCLLILVTSLEENFGFEEKNCWSFILSKWILSMVNPAGTNSGYTLGSNACCLTFPLFSHELHKGRHSVAQGGGRKTGHSQRKASFLQVWFKPSPDVLQTVLYQAQRRDFIFYSVIFIILFYCYTS